MPPCRAARPAARRWRASPRAWDARRLPPTCFGAEACAGGEPGLPAGVGEDLARIQHLGRIEGALHPEHGVEVVGPVDPGHEGVLLDPDAVLPREGSPELDDRP